MHTWTHKALSSTLALSLVGGILGTSIPAVKANQKYTRTFVTTAYYSPLPNQSFYVTGSYRGDKILNGNGTNGASGKEVFEGMLAAPKTYRFGTQVQCGDVLSGTIEDRGGAIVPAGQQYSKFGVHAHDRLDIWAGHGEKGLLAALKWGKRTLTCNVYPSGANLAQYVNLPHADFSPIVKKYTTPKNTSPAPQVATIPQLYKERLDALGYGTDEDNLIAFQLSHGIIDSKESKFAGQFGPNTRNKLNEIFYTVDNSTPREGLSENDVDPEVRTLQQRLNELGYLKAKPTAIFGPKTKAALISFQMDHKLIKDEMHPAAGYVGPGTISKLEEMVLKNYMMTDEEKNQVAEWKRIRQFDIVKRESIEAANELAEHAPTKVEQSPDEIQELLKELGDQWVEEHTPFEENTNQISLATAEVKPENKQLTEIRNKLEPLFKPFQRYLRLGTVSSDVTKVQEFLVKTGYYDGKIISNYYGPRTKAAVIAFQVDHGVVESDTAAGAGIVGPKTVDAFNKVHIEESYTLPNHQRSKSIRKPAIHPDDLKPAIPLQQASAGKSA